MAEPVMVWMRKGDGPPEQVAYDVLTIAARMRGGWSQCAAPPLPEQPEPSQSQTEDPVQPGQSPGESSAGVAGDQPQENQQ